MAQLDKGSNVNATLSNSKYYDENGNLLVIYSAAINYPSTTAGDQATPVVSAITGKKIRILSFAVSSSINGATVFLRSGVGGTQISETILRCISGATSPIQYQRTSYYPIYLFQTNLGQALILNASQAAGVVSVQVVYVLV